MKKEFKEAIEDSPIIAAIKDDEGLKKCLTSESRVRENLMHGLMRGG